MTANFHRLSWGCWFLLAAPLGSMNAIAQTAPSTDTNTNQLNEVVVTGIRASLQSAQTIKRDASSVIEAVTPTDLGQFTDAALTQSLQRVPGVQIYQNAQSQFGGTSSIAIRGLSGDFVTTTVNGRSVLGIPSFGGGGSGRNFDYDSLSPEVISGLVVYKSPTAGLVEPGLAGEVDIHTLRPLEYPIPNGRDFYGSVEGQGIYQRERGKVGPRYSAVFVGKSDDGKLGVYLGGLSSDEYQESKNLWNYPLLGSGIGVGTTVYNNILYPSEVDSIINEYHYTRRDVSGALQWKPIGNLILTVDGLYNRLDTRIDQSTFQNYNGYSLPGVTFAPGGASVQDGELLSYDTAKAVGGYPVNLFAGGSAGLVGGSIDNDNRNWMLGFNAKFKASAYTISFDYAHSNTTYVENFGNAYWVTQSTPQTAITGDYNVSNGNYVAQYYGANTPSNLGLWSTAADPSNYMSFFTEQTIWQSARDQGRIDVKWNTTDWLSIQSGVRIESTHVQTATAISNNGVNPNNGVNTYTIFATPGDPSTGYYSTAGFLTGGRANLPGAPDLPLASRAGFANSNPFAASLSDFGRGSFERCPTSSTITDPSNLLPINGGTSSNVFCIHERTLALYGELDPHGTIWGLDWSGNIGIRALRVNEDASGLQIVNKYLSGVTQILVSSAGAVNDATNSYWKYLPSVNLLLMPRDNINLRFGYAKTVTLPPYSALAPTGTVTYFLPYLGVQFPNSFAGGNTRLKPTQADNFDVTGEYYTSYGGAVVASVFRKNVKDFNTTLTQLQVPISGYSGLFNSTTTVNAVSGHTSGFEIGTNQPFRFLPSPLDGFGLTANYTFVSSGQTVNTASGPINAELPGTAKNNFNGTFYYEKHGFSARVAYNYRGDTLFGVGSNSYNGQLIDSQYMRGYHTIDLSLSQKFLNDHLQVIATATNINKANQVIYYGPAHMLGQFNPLPSTYTLGVRAEF